MPVILSNPPPHVSVPHLPAVDRSARACAAGANAEADRNLPLFPAVPTLLATRLQLELLLSDRSRSVDLRAAAGIVLNDPGATLEIFRRAGEESSDRPHRLLRLEDCLASLGTDAWMDAVCADAVERGAPARLPELTGFWEHARLLAYACWLAAERTEAACPEQAYLAGLLHDAAALPALLAWPLERTRQATGTRGCLSQAAELAAHWRLPAYLQDVVAAPVCPAPWAEILQTAHAWSRSRTGLLRETA